LHFTVARFGLASTGGSANDGAQWIEWSVSVSDSNQDDVAWDGDALVGWIVVNGAKTKITRLALMTPSLGRSSGTASKSLKGSDQS
jgi:hypothetical protein